jgi:hypothetical protein
MSDARNSSGNVRGGGAKQTGGSGRNTRGGGSQGGSKSKLDGLLEPGIDRNAEAKRYLQLQIMSKKLALQVRAAILKESVETGEGPRTEAEYERFDIPMPDPDMAMKRLKAMKEFTKNWYDADFREQWLDSVCEVWAKELQAKYAAFWAAEKHRDGGAAAEGEAMSIEELEVMILSPDTSGDERKRLKNKLKKRRQKENKRKPQSDSNMAPRELANGDAEALLCTDAF